MVGEDFFSVAPALGLAWSSCINTRIMVHKMDCNFIDYERDSSSILEVSETEMGKENKHDLTKSIARLNSEIVSDLSSTNKSILKSKRVMQLMFSPIFPSTSCLFEIHEHGIVGCC